MSISPDLELSLFPGTEPFTRFCKEFIDLFVLELRSGTTSKLELSSPDDTADRKLPLLTLSLLWLPPLITTLFDWPWLCRCLRDVTFDDDDMSPKSFNSVFGISISIPELLILISLSLVLLVFRFPPTAKFLFRVVAFVVGRNIFLMTGWTDLLSPGDLFCVADGAGYVVCNFLSSSLALVPGERKRFYLQYTLAIFKIYLLCYINPS